MKKETIVIATIRPWNITRAKAWKAPPGFRKVIITKKENLTLPKLRRIAPRYIFFPHWSWIIPADVYDEFECIVFHMTDLPFGRGGSPLQNLLSRGIYKTKVSAIRVISGLDEGPVYQKRPLNLSKGSAHDIYMQLSAVSFSMMTDILKHQPKPKPQRGTAVVFPRRTPEMSRLPEKATPRELYDFIRMVDAPEYPAAFIEVGTMRIELRNARLKKGKVHADASITKLEL